MNVEKIIRNNPVGIPEPVGKYTHITKIPRNAELYVTSGQIGTDKNGLIPDDMNEQIRNTFDNIQKVLQSENFLLIILSRLIFGLLKILIGNILILSGKNYLEPIILQ